MKRISIVVTTLLLLSGTIGCVAGYNSLLFTTKTNVGFAVETKPPEINLDIGRQELLLAPTYEEGKTPPVMASFRFDSEKVFNNYLGSAFATGDAAVAMARLYDAEDGPVAKETVWQIVPDAEEVKGNAGAGGDADAEGGKPTEGWKQLEEKFDSSVRLKTKPKMPWFVPREELGAVRPVLFGTDTSFGFKASWSGMESVLPDYVRLAYQRRELAFAAVTIGHDVEGEGDNRKITGIKARTPSLLATVDVKTEVGKFLDTKLEYLQYFASGRAATALAMRQKVRAAMIRRLDPEQEFELGEGVRVNNDPKAVALRDKRVNPWLRDTAKADPNQLDNDYIAAANSVDAQVKKVEEAHRTKYAAVQQHEELLSKAKQLDSDLNEGTGPISSMTLKAKETELQDAEKTAKQADAERTEAASNYKEVEENKASLDQLENGRSDAKDRENTAQGELNTATQLVADATAEVEAAKAKVQADPAKQPELDTAEEKLKEARKTQEKWTKEHNQASAEVATAQGKVDEAAKEDTNVPEAKKQRDDAKAALAEAQKRQTAAQKAYDEAEANGAVAVKKLNTLKKKVEQLKIVIDAYALTAENEERSAADLRAKADRAYKIGSAANRAAEKAEDDGRSVVTWGDVHEAFLEAWLQKRAYKMDAKQWRDSSAAGELEIAIRELEIPNG